MGVCLRNTPDSSPILFIRVTNSWLAYWPIINVQSVNLASPKPDVNRPDTWPLITVWIINSKGIQSLNKEIKKSTANDSNLKTKELYKNQHFDNIQVYLVNFFNGL